MSDDVAKAMIDCPRMEGGRSHKLLVTLSEEEYIEVLALAQVENCSMARLIRKGLAVLLKVQSAKTLRKM